DDQPRGEQKPPESTHPREGDPDQNSQYDDGEQIVDLRPLGSRDEVLCQYIVDDSRMNLGTGIHGTEGGAPQVIDSLGCSADQHNFVGKCSAGGLAAENIADGKMGKGFRSAEVVNEQLAVFIGGYKSGSHLDPVHPVAPDLDRQLRLAQVVPGAQYRQRREEVLAALYDQRHPAHDTIRVTSESEIA